MNKLFTTLLVLVTGILFGQATLPSTWSFTTTSFPAGWTATGTGFYTGSGNTPPALRLDNTGDNLVIWYAGSAGPVTYYITGNSFSGGTFEVQESINGNTWTTMRTFTSNMPSNYTMFTDQPAAASRYVRFNYTTKVSGNVGLDDVSIAAPAAGPQQEINVLSNAQTVLSGGSIWTSSAVSSTTSFTLTVENLGTQNALNIASSVISGTNAAEFVVQSAPSVVNTLSTGNIVIDFTPTAAGTRVATLTITNDDSDEGSYVINLFGAGGGLASEPNAPTNLNFTNVKSYRFQTNWTASSPAADGYIVLRKNGSAVTDAPVDGTTYTVGDYIGTSQVAYIGTSTTTWINYVGASTQYGIAVFAYNGPGSFRNYTNAAPLNNAVTSSGSMQPSNYYNAINTTSTTFVNDLTLLTNPHTDRFYSNYGPYMVTKFWARDTTNGQRVVTCVYSGENLVYTEPFAWVTFSREHTYSFSWMPSNPNTNTPEYSDYFNLYPVNQDDANAVRSNYPLGEVVNVTFSYLGSKYGQDANGRTVYEPRDDQKGDAARSLFYMATCYNSTVADWSFPNPISTSIMYGQDQNLLKAWHYQDLPDAREIAKNDYIDSLQGNRNPFIDSVNYACYIDFNTMVKINAPTLPCSNSTIGIGEVNQEAVVLNAMPNPAVENFMIYVSALENTTGVLQVIDVQGKVINEQTVGLNSGTSAFSFDCKNWNSGMYTIRIQTENQVFLTRMIKN
jgi:Endonuclease I/Secretion system C-terminal sorting domain